MAKFLNSEAAAFHLEELITSARERLALVTPQLKLSGRTKELLAQKSGIDIRLAYGKCELQPQEIDWLRSVPFVRTHFCRSLTAKAYLNENFVVVTSLDLFDFGQVMNNEMGVLISRDSEPLLYEEAAAEVQRILDGGEELRIRMEKAGTESTANSVAVLGNGSTPGKVSTHRLAKRLGLKTHELLDGLQRLGAIEVEAGQRRLTNHGLRLGGEFRSSARFGEYFVWPENFELCEIASFGA